MVSSLPHFLKGAELGQNVFLKSDILKFSKMHKNMEFVLVYIANKNYENFGYNE